MWFWGLFKSAEQVDRVACLCKKAFFNRIMCETMSTVWIDKDRNFKLLVEKLSASAQCKTYFWVYPC